MANFNRGQISERQPHAKGSGAFGYFETTADVTKYTKAKAKRLMWPCGSQRLPVTGIRRRSQVICRWRHGERSLHIDVMDDTQRDRFVSNVAGHLADSVSEKVLVRAFDYWKAIDQKIGERIEKMTRDKIGGKSDAHGMASPVNRWRRSGDEGSCRVNRMGAAGLRSSRALSIAIHSPGSPAPRRHCPATGEHCDPHA